MYFVFFGVGAGFVIISLLVGEISDVAFPLPTFLKPMILATILVVTGGLGLMLTPRFDMPGAGGIVFLISALGGMAAGGLLNRFVIVPLHRAQNTSTFNMQDTIGLVAEVISPIPRGGYGKIRYNVSGSVVTSPAKSEDSEPIPAGQTVEIIYLEKNTYFVRRQTESVYNDNGLPRVEPNIN